MSDNERTEVTETTETTETVPTPDVEVTTTETTERTEVPVHEEAREEKRTEERDGVLEETTTTETSVSQPTETDHQTGPVEPASDS